MIGLLLGPFIAGFKFGRETAGDIARSEFRMSDGEFADGRAGRPPASALDAPRNNEQKADP